MTGDDNANGQPTAEETKPSRRRAKGPLWARLSLLFGTLAIMFAIAEVSLRAIGAKPMSATVLSTYFQFDDATGWAGRPDAECQLTTTNYEVYIKHDADGLRCCGLTSSIKDDAQREEEVVWCLGDSTTWGVGVEDGATYVDHLNQMSKGDRVFRNLGHCGFSSVQQFLQLKRFFEKGYKPDLVMVLFCSNDLADNVDDKDQRPPRAYYKVENGKAALCNYPVPPAGAYGLKVWLKTNSLAFNYLNFCANSAKVYLRGKHRRSQDHHLVHCCGSLKMDPESVSPDQLIAFREAYTSMAGLCKEHDVGFVMAGLEDSNVVAPICDEVGVPVLDASKLFRQHLASSETPAPLGFPTDPHFNELGHRLIAEAIDSELCDLSIAEVSGELLRR